MTRPPPIPSRCARRPSGFTLVEVIVVVIILGLAAGLIVPRIAGSDLRRAEAEARAAAALVSVGAHRSALPGARLALEYDAEQSTLRLVRLDPGPPPGWRAEPLTREVALSASRLSGAFADAAALDDRGWRIELAGAVRRPTLELIIESRTGARQSRIWRIGLRPYASAADLVAGGGPDAWPGAIDLDAVGRGEERW